MPPGRKSWINELEMKEISDLSNQTIKHLLKRTDLTIDQQLKVALPLVLKSMPDKLEVDDVNAISYDEKKQLIGLLRSALLNQKSFDIGNTPQE